ncbi:hypothetical protein Pmani_038614 [Petrolisthes manimaculis]|uniref:Uncharacterized protein n=1 Tax=Petrolisthes manimaculis TaxID=1843537 RepID=A0AAE1NFY4_9EUCA|nr:hypothetical protein Pmani_038614 [Petrolisthes manimaculis]
MPITPQGPHHSPQGPHHPHTIPILILGPINLTPMPITAPGPNIPMSITHTTGLHHPQHCPIRPQHHTDGKSSTQLDLITTPDFRV